MASLIKEYGPEKGKRIYYAMENKGDPATKPEAVKKGRRDVKKGNAGPIAKAIMKRGA